MMKVIYSKKSGKCDSGRINDKGDQENAILDINDSQENAILDA